MSAQVEVATSLRSLANPPSFKSRRREVAKTSAISVESSTKLAAAAGLLAYILGLLVVNSFLLGYGASDFALLRPRFVLIGVTSLLVVVITTGGVCGSAFMIFEGIVGDGLPSGSRALDLFTRVNSCFMGIIVLALPLGALYLLLDSLADAILAYATAAIFGLILMLGAYIAKSKVRDRMRQRRFRYAWQKNIQAPMVLIVWSIFFIPYFALFLIILSTEIMPALPEQLGGAAPREVRILLKEEAVPGITALGLNAKSGIVSTQLLFHGESFYLVRDVAADKTFVVNADLVLAVG